MARKHEAAELLKEGLTLRQIAEKMAISTASVRDYLYSMAGEGVIRRSDIVFAIPRESRLAIENCLTSDLGFGPSDIERKLNDGGMLIDRAEIESYLNLRDTRVSRGDMYEFICEIEETLHDGIEWALKKTHGENWWLNGIPESIRVTCASRREADRQRGEDAYCYTMFIDLREIIDKNWNLFTQVLPSDVSSDKPGLKKTLLTLNEIRNRVMHPTKGLEINEDEFAQVREFHRRINPKKWRKPMSTPAHVREDA